MSESWSEIGRSDDETGQGGTAWSTNGNGVADAPEASIGATDTAEPAAASAVAVSDPDVETTAPEESAPESIANLTPVGEVDQSRSFLSELARAMQATAGNERERVVADTERRRSARIDEIRARETAEADRMRELAAEDQAGIDTWAATEIARIKAEQDRRAEALRADLETSLGQHRELIAQEVNAVETAVATYRSQVDTFFDTLERETDPVAIAQLATRRPVFPSLDTVPLTADEVVTIQAEPIATVESAVDSEPALGDGPVATIEAVAEDAPPDVAILPASEASLKNEPAAAASEPEPPSEPEPASVEEPAVAADETPVAAISSIDRPLVGVMDYTPDPFGDPWRDLPEKVGGPSDEHAEPEAKASAEPESVSAEATLTVDPQEEATAAPSRGRSVLQAVPALRPMGSWLGRHANSDRPDLHG
jgi:hypothetical protein